QTPRPHAPELVRQAALLPLQTIAELGRPQPSARGFRQVHQHLVVRVGQPAVTVHLPAEPGGDLRVHPQEAPPGALLALVQPHGVRHDGAPYRDDGLIGARPPDTGPPTTAATLPECRPPATTRIRASGRGSAASKR